MDSAPFVAATLAVLWVTTPARADVAPDTTLVKPTPPRPVSAAPT